MGFRPLGRELTGLEQFRVGCDFMLYYGISLLFMVCSTQILKYTIRRARPNPLPNTKRIHDLRGREHGTFSMPSGDAAAASVFCYEYCQMMGLPAIYLILPLVICGRVYYQCHWFGDTFAGVLVGTAWGVLMVS